MATQKITHITQRHLDGLSVGEVIQALLGCTAEYYCYKKYYAGISYLCGTLAGIQQFEDDEEVTRYLEGHKKYWQWWKNQWLLRDEEKLPWLLDQACGGRSAGWLTKAYEGIHNVEDMLCDLPEFHALNRSFRVSILPLLDRV